MVENVFSVSMPVYGQSQFISTALESVKAQSVPVELAVLDATPDNSVQQALDGYRSLVAYGYHRKDDGQSAAIQDGWNHTKGGIVTWLNADDYYYPDTLSLVRKAFERDPSVDVVYGHGVLVSRDCDFEIYFPAISEDVSGITRSCTISQPSCFVRREAMEKIGGLDISLHYTMDWDLWIRLYKAGCKFQFLNEVLSATRIYRETKTISGGMKRYAELNRILAENASWPARAKSLLGFYAYDLANSGDGFSKRTLGNVLHAFRSLKGGLVSRGEIKGLERWTNLVTVACEVSIPWFAKPSPKELFVVSDRKTGLRVERNGIQTAMRGPVPRKIEILGGAVDGYEYTGPVEGSVGNQLTMSILPQDGRFRLLLAGAR